MNKKFFTGNNMDFIKLFLAAHAIIYLTDNTNRECY